MSSPISKRMIEFVMDLHKDHDEISRPHPKEINSKIVQELIQNGQENFLSVLSDLQWKIIIRDAQRLKNESKLNSFLPIEAQVPKPEMCGYSASAMTDSLRKLIGNDDSAKTVYLSRLVRVR